MTLTTYRIDFPTSHGPFPAPLTVVAHRFDTMGAAIRYHLRKYLDPTTFELGFTESRGAETRRLVGGTGRATVKGGFVAANFTFTAEPGPTDVEVGANRELAGTTHCPTCGSPEWNPVDVECEDCAAEVARFDGLLDILEEYDVHVVDEVDDNPEKNPRVGFVPFDSTDLPERLLAWRDEAVRAAMAAQMVAPGSGEYPGTPGTLWHDGDGDLWMLCDDGQMRLRHRGPGIDPGDTARTYGPMVRAGGA